MDPKDIVQALESRGWKAEIVSRKDVPDLVDVNAEGLMKCVDGRLSDQAGMRGPKTLGGVYAIASLRGVTSLPGLSAIVSEVAAAGHVPSVHGDEHADEMGCGYFKLWITGRLDNLAPPTYSAADGRKAVLEAGGTYEKLKGNHEESEVMINLVPDTTLEPKAQQRFVVDGWITGKFGLDVPKYLTLAAQTVELLKGPLVARIIVP